MKKLSVERFQHLMKRHAKSKRNWRDELNLSYCGLAEVKTIADMDLSRIPFRFSDFSGITFKRCDFQYTELRFAKLDGCTFEDCYMADIRGEFASFKGASFSRCDFDDSHLPFADFTGAKMQDARFGSSEVYRTDFTGAKLVNVNLREVNIKGCILDGVNLEAVEYDHSQREEEQAE